MKTLLSILNGGTVSPKVSVRFIGLGLLYAMGIFVIALQLRSVL